MKLLEQLPQLLFFTGKGGVGKTSLACATALWLADQGKRVLLISTDPASNLDQVFHTKLASTPTPIPKVENLFALNINPDQAAQAYRDRILTPVRGLLPDEVLRGMEEQLSGACTTEIAAFDEFTEWLTQEEHASTFDHILFDTAPTGHTLRLMQLPGAWNDYLEANRSGTSCLGPLSGLAKQKSQYAMAVSRLTDAALTKIVLVSRPQRSALQEAARTSSELSQLGIHNQHFVVNGLLPTPSTNDSLALAIYKQQSAALREMPDTLQHLPMDQIPLHLHNMVGLEALRQFFAETPQAIGDVPSSSSSKNLPTLRDLVDELEPTQKGVIMIMGKGGVGKTTVAAAVAVELAHRGHSVHLTTTDPAAHLSMTIESTYPHLRVDRIDPHSEVERYRNEVLETQGGQLDTAGKALLEEDLRSPCTEEIAVFRAFSRILQESESQFVVIDTAPTGHTLLLLDAAGAYHREVLRHTEGTSHQPTPLMRLQDPSHTKVMIVTLPETTPILEAESLQSDLRRAGIEPWAWIVNASLVGSSTMDPLLKARAKQEIPHLQQVSDQAHRMAVIPMLELEPRGSERLLQLFASAHSN